MNRIGPGGFSVLPVVVKNLLIINFLFFLATFVFAGNFGVNLVRMLGLHYFLSDAFMPHQLVTHMFMHGGPLHIFTNMFALWMFGSTLENVWGPKRFLFFYMFTGLGAAALHIGVIHLQVSSLLAEMNPDDIALVFERGRELFDNNQNFREEQKAQLNRLINIPTVGASGAVFGVLLGFGLLFPNTRLFLLFPPIPIKAKYFVIFYGLFELYAGYSSLSGGSNIAHFAHLGGMLFGFILIKYWNKRSRHFF